MLTLSRFKQWMYRYDEYDRLSKHMRREERLGKVDGQYDFVFWA